ncbi:hypothetical protein VDP25_15825 [Winogradskyella sp. ECml5-4]|uniref:hypothetical protein n=1 Tax=Winogradskyella sp. ECml5-4 TaxID=3110975 RepID=UPI002FF1CD49
MSEKIRKFRSLFKHQSLVGLLSVSSSLETLYNKLTEEEIDVLANNNVLFIRTVSPSSTIKLQDIDVQGILTLINIDANQFKMLLPEEVIAILLHEIGHVFNPNILGIEGEYIADNFAKTKGYAKWIISGLNKGLKNKWIGFEEDEIELRVTNLREN